MKRLISFTVIVIASFFLIGTVNAQPVDKLKKPKAGLDWYEKVMRERAIKDRAAEERNAMKQSARMGDDSSMTGVTVDAYNAMILEKNAAQMK